MDNFRLDVISGEHKLRFSLFRKVQIGRRVAVFLFPLRTFLSVVIIAFVALPGAANAANWYVRPSAQGSVSGADWNNAWSASAINWGSVRAGDTVWLAAGSYSAGLNVGSSGTASSPITISAVAASSSAPTSAAGYSSSFASNGTTQQVLIPVGSGGTGINMGSSSYVTITGALWSPPGLPSAYGIKISIPGTAGGTGVSLGNNEQIIDVEVAGPAPNTISGAGMNQTTSTTVAMYGGSNSVISGCKLHDMDCPIQYCSQGVTIQYCTIYDVSSGIQPSGTGSDPHPDWAFSNQPFTNYVIRYCLVSSVVSEGLFFANFGSPMAPGGTFVNLIMYGCVCFQGDSALAGCQCIEVKTQQGNYGAFYIYNNTFVDWSHALLNDGPSTGWISSLSTVQNNLFVNSNISFDNGGAPGSPGSIVTTTNGYCFGASKTDSPADANPIQGGSVSPFVAGGYVKGSGNPPAFRGSDYPVGYDPTQYLNDFQLVSGSWAAGKGKAVPATIQGIAVTIGTDMNGNSLTNVLGALGGTGSQTPQAPQNFRITTQ